MTGWKGRICEVGKEEYFKLKRKKTRGWEKKVGRRECVKQEDYHVEVRKGLL